MEIQIWPKRDGGGGFQTCMVQYVFIHDPDDLRNSVEFLNFLAKGLDDYVDELGELDRVFARGSPILLIAKGDKFHEYLVEKDRLAHKIEDIVKVYRKLKASRSSKS